MPSCSRVVIIVVIVVVLRVGCARHWGQSNLAKTLEKKQTAGMVRGQWFKISWSMPVPHKQVTLVNNALNKQNKHALTCIFVFVCPWANGCPQDPAENSAKYSRLCCLCLPHTSTNTNTKKSLRCCSAGHTIGPEEKGVARRERVGGMSGLGGMHTTQVANTSHSSLVLSKSSPVVPFFVQLSYVCLFYIFTSLHPHCLDSTQFHILSTSFVRVTIPYHSNSLIHSHFH